MQAAHPTSDHGVTLRWWETAYTTVTWDYPSSPAAYYDALLTRGASHSRFLRIAYSSTRRRVAPSSSCPSSPTSSSTDSLDAPSPLSPHHVASTTPAMAPRRDSDLPPLPPYSLLRSCAHAGSRSAHPAPHVLGRRKPQWSKPPHYHATLLRKPVCRRRGLFRGVLPPERAVDFFRWDVLGKGASLSSSWKREGWAAEVHVVEEVLGPYEAAAGFFGWHGLGLDVARRARNDRVRCWSQGLGFERGSPLRFEIDEAAVEEGRALWARTAEELVGPPGLVLRSVVEDGKSGKVTPPSDHPAHDLHLSSRREHVRWDPDMGSSPFRPPRAVSASDEKRPHSASVRGSSPCSKLEHKSDSPSAWWHGPSPHRGPPPTPHVPSLRFLPPPSVQYGPPPLHFSPWFPNSRVSSAQGHGYWYGAQPVGAPSSATRDPKSVGPHPHVFATPPSSASPRYPAKPTLGRDEYRPGHDDKETETDHGYESATTTTDSDPPPHTPIGAATSSHCVEALQLHGDDEVEVHGVDIDGEHASASVTIRLSDPSTPVKLPDRFTASPSLSSGSLDSHQEGESSRAAVVFPSLNGSFCQGPTSVVISGPGMSAQTTPARTVTPVSASSSQGDEQDSKRRDVSGDEPALTLSPCSPPSPSPRPGLRKDLQGFWEPAPPSPLSSSSSLPLSPSERKMGRICRGVGGESCEVEVASPSSTLSAKTRSSPGSGRVVSEGSLPASFSSPASHSGLPSSPNGPSISSNPTTLLPAFLTTASVKRKKASRTREIIDRLKSSSIDGGKSGGSESLGWLAASVGEGESKVGKASTGSDHAAGNQAVAGPSSPSTSGVESGSWARPEMGREVQGSKVCDGSSGKTQGGSDAATTTNSGITPFPILSVSQSQASSLSVSRQSQTIGSVITTPSKNAEGPKMTTPSPISRSAGPPLVPSMPNGGTSPTVRPCHHPLPSPPHPVHPPPALGPPPPILTVSPYPHPMYVPFTQYHLAPAHQGQQGQGTWVAVYPGHAPHVPVHPIPAPITGVSGMRHVSW